MYWRNRNIPCRDALMARPNVTSSTLNDISLIRPDDTPNIMV